MRVDFEADDPQKLLDAISAFCDEAWDRGGIVPSQESSFTTAGWSYKAELLPPEEP